jgi:H+-transporting ATPase
MYLKLSVAGHLTIFLTRTRGPFWSIRPAKILWMAVLGTQTVATLIAVYGLFMTPLGWKWAGFVWIYAIAWALINDRIKLLAYKIFDHPEVHPNSENKGNSTPAETPAPSTEANTEPKPNASSEPKTDRTNDAPKADAQAQPAAEAKDDAPKPDAKPDQTKPDTNSKQKADATTDALKADSTAHANAEVKDKSTKSDATVDAPEPQGHSVPAPEINTDKAIPQAKPEPAPKDNTGQNADIAPRFVKRVHEFYEELGREDVQTVQDWEKAEMERHNK